MPKFFAKRRRLRTASACGAALFAVAGVVVPASLAAAAPAQARTLSITSTGLRPSAIKHV